MFVGLKQQRRLNLNLKEFRMYQKVNRVIDSCETFEHYLTARSLVYNFGRYFGFSKMWSKLDTRTSNIIKEYLDKEEYQERLQGIDG